MDFVTANLKAYKALAPHHKVTKKKVYRVEHPKDNRGLFWSKHWARLQKNPNHYKEIIERFREVNVLTCDFPSSINELSLSNFKCAFKNVDDLLKILPVHLIDYIIKRGFSLVEIESTVIESETQAIFVDENVKRKSVPLKKLPNLHAKQVAMQDLKEEFKTLNAENYIIFN